MANEPFIYPGAEALRQKGRNYTSQFGEDGYIAAALEQIGITNKWCFEVGAADGEFYSNTKILRDAGWSAVLIENDVAQHTKLLCHTSSHVWAYLHEVQPASLDVILAQCQAPVDLDLGIVDIDGQDYYIWDGLKKHSPRLMLVEYSPYGTPDDLPELNAAGQAGLNPILALGKRKGYLPLVRTVCNVLFARADIWTHKGS